MCQVGGSLRRVASQPGGTLCVEWDYERQKYGYIKMLINVGGWQALYGRGKSNILLDPQTQSQTVHITYCIMHTFVKSTHLDYLVPVMWQALQQLRPLPHVHLVSPIFGQAG